MSTATKFSRQDDAGSWILRKSCFHSRPRSLQSKFSNKYIYAGWNYSVVICKINGKTINNVFLIILLLFKFFPWKRSKKRSAVQFQSEESYRPLSKNSFSGKPGMMNPKPVKSNTELNRNCIYLYSWKLISLTFPVLLNFLEGFTITPTITKLINFDNLPQ